MVDNNAMESVQSFGWNTDKQDTRVFERMSEEFKDSKEFTEASEEFKAYVNTADKLAYSGVKEQMMADMFEKEGLKVNPFYNVEPLLSDALHYPTDFPYGISSTVACKNTEAISGYDDSFGLRNVVHTTDDSLNKVLTSAKEVGYDKILIEIYKRKQLGKCGIEYGT